MEHAEKNTAARTVRAVRRIVFIGSCGFGLRLALLVAAFPPVDFCTSVSVRCRTAVVPDGTRLACASDFADRRLPCRPSFVPSGPSANRIEGVDLVSALAAA